MLKHLARGIATFVPGAHRAFSKKRAGATESARYCYSVWLRHLVTAQKYCLATDPQSVAELGPGDSLGVGLAALISGADRYLAFDVVKFASIERNVRAFDHLVELFQTRSDIPAADEYPNLKPDLEGYTFPGHILTESRLGQTLEPGRLEKIRNAVVGLRPDDPMIQYRAPWFDPGVIEKETVDMIYSQAVMEHVDDLPDAYSAMRLWLKPNGFVSHQIDFKAHATADEWNGHWTYSDLMWKLVRGNRPYLLNRAPHSTHIDMLKRKGFEVVCDEKVTAESSIERADLASRFTSMTDDDLMTTDAMIQAVKKVPGEHEGRSSQRAAAIRDF